MNSKDNYHIGLIGCGRIAKVHAEAIQKIDGFSLAAVCDLVSEKVKEFSELYGAEGYRRYTDLLNHTGLSLIVIATPNGTHYEIAKKSFEKDFHVLLEKPITIYNRDAEDLIHIARQKRKHFFAVKQVRYNPSIQILKAAIDHGKLGNIFSSGLVVRWTRPQIYFDQSDWRGKKKLDGGSLLNQGIHYVDIMQWLIGDVNSVFGKIDRRCHNIEIEDMVFGLIHFKSGALGSVEFTINTYPKNLECSLTILGEKGSVKLSGSAMNEIEIWEVQDYPKPVVPEGFHPYIYEGGLYQGSCPNHIFVYQDIIKVFHGKQSNFVDGEEALRSLKIVNGLYDSSKIGKEVQISL